MFNAQVATQVSLIVSAKLITLIEIARHGIFKVQGDPGLNITVDMETNVALINGRHVQLNNSDYEVLNQN